MKCCFEGQRRAVVVDVPILSACFFSSVTAQNLKKVIFSIQNVLFNLRCFKSYNSRAILSVLSQLDSIGYILMKAFSDFPLFYSYQAVIFVYIIRLWQSL